MSKARKVQVQLSCGCWLRKTITSAVNEQLIQCRFHGHQFASISAVFTSEWRARCAMCNFGAMHGQSREHAERAGNNHARLSGHEVHVKYADIQESLDEMSNSDGNLATLFDMPVTDDPAPF